MEPGQDPVLLVFGQDPAVPLDCLMDDPEEGGDDSCQRRHYDRPLQPACKDHDTEDQDDHDTGGQVRFLIDQIDRRQDQGDAGGQMQGKDHPLPVPYYELCKK